MHLFVFSFNISSSFKRGLNSFPTYYNLSINSWICLDKSVFAFFKMFSSATAIRCAQKAPMVSPRNELTVLQPATYCIKLLALLKAPGLFLSVEQEGSSCFGEIFTQHRVLLAWYEKTAYITQLFWYIAILGALPGALCRQLSPQLPQARTALCGSIAQGKMILFSQLCCLCALLQPNLNGIWLNSSLHWGIPSTKLDRLMCRSIKQ